MRTVIIDDNQTSTELVFVRYSDSVDVYMTSPEQEVNDYMEENQVIQSYDLKDFERLFPEIFKKLGEII